MADDPLRDFDRSGFTHEGKHRTVFRHGTGPAVIVIAEIPGITPKVAGFARKVADIGCTAVMPHLFGEPGRDPSAAGRGSVDGVVVRRSGRCASAASSRCGRPTARRRWSSGCGRSPTTSTSGAADPASGAVGMCFTGGYALAMATHPSLLAPVLSQPSMPIADDAPSSGARSTARPTDLAIVKDRCASEGLQVLGLRFKGDRFVPPERFEFLREQLGDAFVAVELEDEHGQPRRRPVAPLGAHRAPHRRAGPAHPRRARPGARPVPHPPAELIPARPRPASRGARRSSSEVERRFALRCGGAVRWSASIGVGGNG